MLTGRSLSTNINQLTIVRANNHTPLAPLLATAQCRLLWTARAAMQELNSSQVAIVQRGQLRARLAELKKRYEEVRVCPQPRSPL